MEDAGKITLCSSFDLLNDPSVEREECAKIKITEKDDDFDGVSDEIRLEIELHTMLEYGVKSFSAVFFLDSRLNHQCNVRVPAAVIINKKTFWNNVHDRTISIKGSLQPVQSQSLICPFFLRNVKSHFFYENLNQTLEHFHLAKIQETLEKNPLHFEFVESSTDLQEIDKGKTTIKIRMKIPEVEVRYQKTFWQALNELWVNYFAVLMITIVTANFLLSHLFEKRWLLARELLPKDKQI